jgi:hypothetical protein
MLAIFSRSYGFAPERFGWPPTYQENSLQANNAEKNTGKHSGSFPLVNKG